MASKRAEAVALAIPRPALAAHEIVWPALLAISTVAAIAPLWASELLPYQDAPQHLAAVRVLDPSLRRAILIAVAGAGLLWSHPSALAFALAACCILVVTSGTSRRTMARALAPWLPAILLFGAWALHALATRDGPGAVARTPPHWMGLKMQVLELARFGNVLAGLRDEAFAAALFVLFAAVVAVRPRPPIERSWRVPLLAALTFAAYMAAPFDMGYIGYIHTRAMPFLVLLVIASPSIAPGRTTGAILAAAVGLQIAYQAQVAASYRAFDREAQVQELHQVLNAADPASG